MLKEQKGITLVALVITIIVLLILAGVTIAMLTGNNGVLTKANDAKTESTNAEVAERINMELNAFKADIMADGKVSESTFTTAVAALGDGYSITPAAFSGVASADTIVIAHTDTSKSGTIYLKDSADGTHKKGEITAATK